MLKYPLISGYFFSSIMADPLGARKNTKDNTPAVVHITSVKGDKIEVEIAAKGDGSENKSKMAMLNPSDSLVNWIVNPFQPRVLVGVHQVF